MKLMSTLTVRTKEKLKASANNENVNGQAYFLRMPFAASC